MQKVTELEKTNGTGAWC